MALHILCKLRLRPSCFPGLCTILLVMCSPLYCSLTKSEAVTSCHSLRSDLEEAFALNLTDRTAFCIPNTINPGAAAPAFEDFSFNVSFNVRIFYQKQSQTKNSVALAIHLIPYYDMATTYALCPTTQPDPCNNKTVEHDLCVEYINNGKTRTYPAVASNVSTRINDTLILVQIDMDSAPQDSSPVENIYAVTVGYQQMGDSNIRVDVSGDGMRDPVHDTAPWFYGAAVVSRKPISMSMGFFSSMGQLVNIDNWNVQTDAVQILTGPELKGRQTSSTATILSSVLGSAGAVAVTATVVYIYFNSKYRRWKKEQDRLAKIMQGLPGVPTKVDFTDIKKATKNFHDKMKLGKGGFGAVYRCTLPASASRTGQAMEVAVKKFTQEVEDRRFDDFLAEVSIINRLRHKNIVPLVGWSYDKGVPVLVYEYMKNGSLDQHLFQRSGGHNKQHDHSPGTTTIGEWDTRYGIVRDVATGLHYVHHEHEPMVLHRDIKASNIMLDSTFRARLGDFGIACTVALDRSSVTGVAGTIGYIAPDCVISHKATRQSDIYAFGVLILEIVTGNKSGDVPPDDGHITDWIWRLRQEGKLLEAVDSGLQLATDDERRQQDTADEAERLLLLGLACANPNPSNRPSMVEVVQIIAKSAPPPELPIERPIFVWPPEDWRARNSIYSTGMSDWESTIELGEVSEELPLSAARTS